MMTSNARALTAALALLLPCAAGAAETAVVLMYHRFGEDTFPSTSIRVAQFEAHLEHLQDAGYSVVPLADVVAALDDGAALPDNAVAITIDDAYRSVYDVAFPMLRSYGYPFTVFVATDAVDQGLDANMSWDQMREMAAYGATFANHGAAHTSVIEQTNGESQAQRLARIRLDIDEGWQRLSEELAPLPGVFAYPYGEYDSDSANLLQEMGLKGFGQHSGAIGPGSDERALPRFPMAESFADIAEFRTKVASLPMPVLAVEPWDPIVTTVQPQIEVTLAETDARLGELACYVSAQGRVDVNWLEPERKFTVRPRTPLSNGRQRVNCTAPRDDGRYLWFSHPWIVQPQRGVEP